MKLTRRRLLGALLGSGSLYPLGKMLAQRGKDVPVAGAPRKKEGQPLRIVRFECRGKRAYGIVEASHVIELERSPFVSPPVKTDMAHPLAEVKLLVPCEPTKVLAMLGNYKSPLRKTPLPPNPELFLKVTSSLLDPEGTIVIPRGTSNVHCEAELVAVIGKKAQNVSEAEAASCIFGVTCGNDVTSRDWQKSDQQWWRAKACDTFAPMGPWIVQGIDYGDLLLTTRLNGEVKQRFRTSELIFNIPTMVSFISRHITLFPGDVIYTGTSSTTCAMKPGDVVLVEIEKIGTLRNRVG